MSTKTKSKTNTLLDQNEEVKDSEELKDSEEVEPNTNTEDDIIKEFEDICSEFANLKNSIGSLTLKLRQYKKKIDKLVKDSSKVPKNKPTKGKKAVDKETGNETEKGTEKVKEKKKKVIEPPSGINKPCLLSDDLCIFLGKPLGTEMLRSDVTDEMYKYFREKKLQDSVSKLTINADETIQKLLDINETHKLTYQNLQTYMNKHYLQSNLE